MSRASLLTAFLDWWLGPRTACVVEVRAPRSPCGWTYVAIEVSRLDEDDAVIATGLRWGAAEREARRLRRQCSAAVAPRHTLNGARQ